MFVKQEFGCTSFLITVGFCSSKSVQANQPGLIEITMIFWHPVGS